MINMNCPKLDSNIVFLEHSDYILTFNRFSKDSFRITVEDYNILRHMNGTNNICTISEMLNLDESTVEKTVCRFKQLNFFNDTDDTNKGKRISKKFALLDPSKLFQKNSKKLVVLFNLITISFTLALFFALIFFMIKKVNIYPLLYMAKKTPMLLITIAIISLVCSIFLHEMGHAICAMRFGKDVVEIGVMLKHGILFAYTTILGLNKDNRIMSRALIMAYGMYANVFLACISYIFYTFSSKDIAHWFLVPMFVNIFLLLFNLSPTSNTDGRKVFDMFFSKVNKHNKIISIAPLVIYKVIFIVLVFILFLFFFKYSKVDV